MYQQGRLRKWLLALIKSQTKMFCLWLTNTIKNLNSNVSIFRVISQLILKIITCPQLALHRHYWGKPTLSKWLADAFYGFEVNEIVNEKHPNLDLDVDPKLSWALRHPEQFPVDLNRADYQMILRVPGIGVKSAKKIVQARRFGKIHIDLLKNSVWPTNEQNSLFAVKTVQNSKKNCLQVLFGSRF